METAPVSVIIPSYDCGRYVVEAVESVMGQTVLPRQVILIDDGSTDDTAERLAPFRGRIEYVRQENAGVSAARNRGVAAAREPFVAFLDADDVWHPRKTELQLGVFRRMPELGIVSAPTFDWPAACVPMIPADAAPRVTTITWAQMVVRNRMNTSSLVARRELLGRAGPFDTELQGPEDRDMWLRLVELAPAASLDVPLSGYRITAAGISRDADRCRAGMLRTLRKLDARGAWNGRRALRRRAYSYAEHACAYLYSAQRRQARALGCALRSFAHHPLPHAAGEMCVPFERSKRAAVIALRLLRLKAPDRAPRMHVEPASAGPGPALAAG